MVINMLRHHYSINVHTILICLLLVNWMQTIVTEKCIRQADNDHPKYIYYKGQKINLTLATTSRLTHRLATHAFKIILEDVLGYRQVQIVNIEDNLDFRTAIVTSNSYEENGLPNWLINLEVWTPTNESYTVHLLEQCDLKDSGSLSPPGRFGWFISRKKYKNANQLDIHWTVFKNRTMASRFDVSKSTLQQYIEPNLDGSTKCLGCTVHPEFKNGSYIPEWCENTSCATLLAPFYNSTYFVVKHIKILKLYVKVYWLGDNLQKVVDALDEPVMMLSWTPSLVIPSEDHFLSVSFPSCNALQTKNIYDCKYETTRLTKISWINLKSKSIYNYLHLFEFDKTDYEQFFEEYKNNVTIEQSACQWVQKSLDTYKMPNEKIFIGGIFPLTGNASLTTTANGILLAAKMAKKAINQNKILKNFDLELIPHNGQCESNHVMKAFINMVRYNDRLLGILGPGCSETVEPLAGVSKLYNTIIISYSAEGVSFADRTKYPFFFRTIGDNQQFIPVYRDFFKKMNWKSISALTEDGQKYTEYLSHMSQQDLLLENKKFPREREPNDMKKYLEELKNKRARIIIVDVTDEVARSVMCEAYNLNMTAKHGYVWFLPEWFSYDWYNTTYYNKKKNESVPCSVDKMLESVNGYFSLSHAFFASNDSITSIDNRTVGEWRQTYETECRGTPNCIPSNYAGYTYDAVWTYAFAFKKLLEVMPDAIYTLHSENTTKKFVEFIQNTDFNGVSGHIVFEKSASRYSVVHIKQWINQTKHLVGYFYPNMTIGYTNQKGTLTLNESAIIWLAGSLPTDGTEPPHKCIVEGFATFLDVECDKAILIINVIGISTLIPILAVIIFFIKRKYEQKVLEHQKLMNKKFGLDLVKLNTLDKWEIPRENVVINRKLGQGAFGTVYGGEAYFPEKGWVGVAVKTLKVGSTTEERLDFLSEAEVMKRFDHKNIVKLLGVCTQNEPVYTVMEFMLYGDLKTFLLARRHLINDRSFEENDEISSKKLTSMALDVARALSYLAEMKFVHRDIACRNCLLNAQRMVKLGDFGMTRPVFENDYYKFNRRGMLPVRWMAPESLALGVFTPSSDIWSYGVLLYEIITFGSFPFQGKTNTEVLEYVKEGNILKIPSGAKPQLEALIKSCWNFNAKNRPHASQIVEFLANFPRLLSPCLDAPLSSVEMCNTSNDGDVPLPEAFRKCSVDRYPRNEIINEIDNRHTFIRQQSTSSALLSDEESSVLSAESVHLENYVKEPLLGGSANVKVQKVDENKLLKRQPSNDYKLLESGESGFSIQNDSIL